jgi:hypothetical protein
VNNLADVTAYISTKDRYLTTLPLAIASIAMQTVLPKKFILFEDSEPIDIRTNNTYLHLLHILSEKEIEWEVVFGKKMGQVHNHQMAIEKCKTEWLWRIDDDNIVQPNVLGALLKSAADDEKVGAVAGLVIDPTQIQTIDDLTLTNRISGVYDMPNAQWMKHQRKDTFQAEHLYSSFIYRKRASKHGYCTKLSPVGHREETMFSHEMHRAGWKLLINPNVITWHLREPTGGIRAYTDKAYWEHDEEIFKEKMKQWQATKEDNTFYVVLDNGMGDHYMFKTILPDLIKKHGKNLVIACCYPAIFEAEVAKHDIKLISIQDAKNRLNDIEKYNVYKFCGEGNWNKHLIEAFREIYK